MVTDPIAPENQLASFLAKYTPEIAARAEAVLVKLRKQLPHALELVYDNYNALAVGFGPTEKPSEAIFSIAVFPKWVSLFFLQAKGLPDPKLLLKGSGNVAKHVVLEHESAIDDPAIQELMRQAIERAVVPFDRSAKHRLIIRSVSAKQRPRRPAAVTKVNKRKS
ncbi:MAG TPA: hypothetical protein VH325_18700 [Bryobacteraceae bacterium]|jgi:hypothetical protein|nr:hypothetical protein [Bryobacteraceae bacterium]